MSELKRSFGSAKMNKDLDERLVPNGEYRDALNIQISTTDDSDVGSMQTIKGNTLQQDNVTSNIGSQSKVIGSIADEKNNKIYYFVAGYPEFIDYILEYDTVSGSILPVVVDVYSVTTEVSSSSFYSAGSPNSTLNISDQGGLTSNLTNVRPGMRVIGNFDGVSISFASNIRVQKLKRGILNDWEIFLDDYTDNLSLFTLGYNFNQGETVVFKAERNLNFNLNQKLTGINIIGNELFWTDGRGEPKRINIIDCKAGTDTSGLYHTRIPIKRDDNTIITFQGVDKIDRRVQPAYLSEEYITTIKKSPLYPPTLILSNTSDGRINSDGTPSTLTSSVDTAFINHDDENLSPGDIKNITFNTTPDYLPGDTIILRRLDEFTDGNLNDYEVAIEILEYDNTTGDAKIKIIWIEDNPSGGAINDLVGGVPQPALFFSMLKQEKPLYEFKLPRFAYRYKFKNNQYSCYSPFSEPAFLPGDFDYVPKEGYNLGMVNTLRSLYVMDFVQNTDAILKDVIEIDILYKESNSNNIYTVRTIKETDDEFAVNGSASTVSNLPLWMAAYARTRGAIRITTEMVRAAVASNQLLRPWDNVPRNAKSQEVVGNRIVYANYLQNYNLT